MDTSNLKRFATAARSILKQGVINKFAMLGFDAEGNVKPENEPQPVQGGALFKGQVIDDPAFYPRWQSLRHRVGVRGIRDVYEEAAYTWFNRFMAISILQHNGLMAPALQFESDDVRIPLVVANARRGLLPTMADADRTRLSAIINDDNLTTEQFAILITSLCQFTPILKACFGGITDYTALLLPDDILAKDGFIDMLNHTSFITDDDYRQSELIGWLYQFYISERKDEVFASFKSGHKAEAEDIPAATQIFTPNWIVKYMVQNTLGRIYLDDNPDCPLKDSWQYLVEAPEPVEGSPSERGQGGVLQLSSLEDYTFADLSCGSGHILGEAFDLLYALYQQEFYSPREAITAIFTRNLTGVDIDTRARQLSCFALLLKACQIDSTFSNAQVLPHVLDMPEPYTATDLQAVVTDYLVDADTTTIMQVINAVELMKHAYNLGSIMKFELSAESRAVVARCTEEWLQQPRIPAEIQNMMHYMRILLALTDKYAAVVMNPPYMGNGNMNETLSRYVRENYEIGKADLCTVFMLMQAERTIEGGYYANIVPPSWMFLSTFEALRRYIIDNQAIHSLLHLSRGVFGADFGSVSTVIQNRKDENAQGTYFRLIERTFQEFDQRHLKLLFEKTLSNHDFRFKFIDYSKDVTDIVYSSDGAKIYYPVVPQSNFKKIPGCPVGYWVSEKFIESFVFSKMVDVADPKAGLATGDNNRFQRYWYEVSVLKIGFNYQRVEDTSDGLYKWFPCNSGGTLRKWSCNNELVVNWENNGEELRSFRNANGKLAARPQNTQYYFKEGLTWNKISSSNLAVKYKPSGFIFDDTSRSAFIQEDNHLKPLIGFLCSCVALNYLKFFNPTMSFTNGDIARVPINNNIFTDEIALIVQENISISKQDWDAHETSWDFKENELLRIFKGIRENPYSVASYDKDMSITLETVVEAYKREWECIFMQLHKNEEELNRQFIEIYGLQDELSPEVPLEEVTILQQGEKTVVNSSPSDGYEVDENTDYGQRLLIEASKDIRLVGLYWNEANIIQQLISYAIGCYMGRYRLDRPGLHIAHPNPTAEELQPYEVPCLASRSPESFTIDEDAIIPILPRECGFPDNLLRRITNFIEQVFGSDALVANLNFIEATLGKSLEDYLSKDFWKEHVKRYQKRPIYWLFSSKKGAFKVITYMHRMDAFTVATIRNHYLLPYINTLETRVDALRVRQAELTTPERRNLERLIKDLEDCREYDLRLHQVADRQITFDLDDGVVHNYALFGDVLSKL